MKQDRLPHKIYHQLNFYIGVACFFGIFYTPDATLAGILFVACIANLASAQGMANKDNLEHLNERVNGKSKAFKDSLDRRLQNNKDNYYD